MNVVISGKESCMLMRGFILCVTMQFFFFSGKAQTTWVGGTSTAWATASNWNPATVPVSGSTTSVIIDAGTFMPTLPSAYILGSLVINAGSTLCGIITHISCSKLVYYLLLDNICKAP